MVESRELSAHIWPTRDLSNRGRNPISGFLSCGLVIAVEHATSMHGSLLFVLDSPSGVLGWVVGGQLQAVHVNDVVPGTLVRSAWLIPSGLGLADTSGTCVYLLRPRELVVVLAVEAGSRLAWVMLALGKIGRTHLCNLQAVA